MKGKIQQAAQIEPGTYVAKLKAVTAWLTTKFQSEDMEPTLTFVWELEGETTSLYDSFIRIPLDQDGYPALKEVGKLYNRLSALYGSRFKVDEQLNWELILPEAYDSPEGLMSLPTYEERKEEGFRPIEVRSIKVAGRELIGGQCLLVVGEKNGRIRVLEAGPLPRGRQSLY